MFTTNKNHKLYGWAGLGGLLGLLVVFLTSIFAYYLFDREVSRQKAALAQLANKVASTIEHEMSIRAYSMLAMRRAAESVLDRRIERAADVVPFIQAVAEKNGYTLAQLPSFGVHELGRITGLGALPHAGSDVAQEISMAIALTPMFQTVLERDVETPWVYYISANRFIYLYPQVSTEDYFFEEIALKRDYHRLALPESNPTKSIYWTPAYVDDGGKGMMVTVGAPVYQGVTFKGSLSIDIALSKLNWLLDGYDYSNLQLSLYDNSGQLLSQYPLKAQPLLGRHVKQDGFFTADGTLAYKASLKAVPWHLVATTSSSKIAYAALWRTLPVVLVILLLVAGLVLIKVLAKSLKQVHELSIVDGLTGVYNRRHFDSTAVDYLARIRRQGNFAGLVLLDMDFFKLYNDTYGHQAGDYALIAVANILKEKLQRPTRWCVPCWG